VIVDSVRREDIEPDQLLAFYRQSMSKN
jgi:hypothetical protein